MQNKLNELERKEQELEQTLEQQLSLLQNDSKDWLKIGGLALAGGLLTYAIINRKNKKEERKIESALAALEKEGLLTDEIEERLSTPRRSSFWPNLSQRLLILGLALAKEKFLPQLMEIFEQDGEPEGPDS